MNESKGAYYIDETKRKLNVFVYRQFKVEKNQIYKYIVCTYNKIILTARYSYKTKKIYICDIIKDSNENDINEIETFLNDLHIEKIKEWNKNEIFKNE